MPRRHPSTDRASAVSVVLPGSFAVMRSDIRLNDACPGGLRTNFGQLKRMTATGARQERRAGSAEP
jgi:hypothetical protein